MDEPRISRKGTHKGHCIVVASRHPELGLNKTDMALLADSNEVIQLEFDYSRERIFRFLPRTDVIVSIYMARVTAKMMDAAPNLRGVVTFGSGHNHVDVVAATERGIYVSNNPGANAESVAELAFSMMLNLMRNTWQADQLVRAGEWRQGSELPSWLSGKELWKKTLGILGLGNIGRRVARIAKGFEMRVLAYDPYVSSEVAREAGATLVELTSLLREADVVTIHTPLSAETESLIDREGLRLMKPTSYLLNLSRGAVVNEEALLGALREGWIAGAGLDVFDVEPIPSDHPFLELDNVILTPHYAGGTAEARDRQSAGVVRRVVQILRGEIPDNLVNEALGAS